MRPLALGYFLALLAFPALAADEPGASSSPTAGFSRSKFRHSSISLRDTDSENAGAAMPPRGSFTLPPGGRELELQPTASTPYDRYFGSVRYVISTMEPHTATMAGACHLMKVGHSFEYKSRDPYRPDPPRLTELQHSGDCKSKALWLYGNLADSGALFVIGKAEKNLRTSHAWVYWRCDGRWWILDCTERADPIAADTVSSNRYVPYYSFGKYGTYRHPASQLNEAFSGGVSANPASAVAVLGQRKSP
ncbi:MAG TPA: hypothetical protein VGM54_17380 [Chthoniobacter sp.]|jgi:hypothetical protein